MRGSGAIQQVHDMVFRVVMQQTSLRLDEPGERQLLEVLGVLCWVLEPDRDSILGNDLDKLAGELRLRDELEPPVGHPQ